MSLRNTRCVLAALFVLATLTARAVAVQEEPPALDWPREIEVPQARIVIYQPQLETFDGDRLTARSAISVTPAEKEEPIFGAVWFDAKVATDRNERTIRLLGVEVSDAKLPTATPEQLEKLGALLASEITSWDPVISLDRVLTALELAEMERESVDGLKTDPPKIRLVTYPAVLVTIDGEPQMKAMEGTSLMRVVNSPAFIVFEPTWRAYFLTDGAAWLTAPEIKGPWVKAENLPAAVRKMSASEPKEDAPSAEKAEAEPDKMPQIIVATEPTELVVLDGAPSLTQIEGTGLLFIANTDSDLFVEIDSQRYYLLISGRWYGSDSLKGNWAYIASEALPADFAAIPPASAKGSVLASVAGTDEAVDAVSETYIPQTAAIDRKNATVNVEYDGEPEFEPIESTSMAYAVNTSESVIRVDGVYYCCHEAVWFMATGPSGPWAVCVSVPDVIYTMPPSSPVYNVRYVKVYESTPEVVYVGYTPGYTGCYAYGGTVVYGTGYVYPAWRGAYYYPRPATYGFSFHYNSYTGNWGVRTGYGYYGHGAVVAGPRGFAAVGPYGGVAVGYRGGGWYGAGGYRRYGDVNFNSSISGPRGTLSRNVNVDRDWDGDVDVNRNVSWEPNENVYDRRENAKRNVEDRRGNLQDRRETAQGNLDDRRGNARGNVEGRRAERGSGTRSQRANDIFSERNGNVHRRSAEGWQRRENGGWSKPEAAHPRSPSADRRTPGARDRGATNRGTTGGRDRTRQTPSRGATNRRTTQRPSANRSSSRNLERHHQSRQRGSQRTQSYQKSRSSRGSSRGGSRGGGRRGGGRRR